MEKVFIFLKILQNIFTQNLFLLFIKLVNIYKIINQLKIFFIFEIIYIKNVQKLLNIIIFYLLQINFNQIIIYLRNKFFLQFFLKIRRRSENRKSKKMRAKKKFITPTKNYVFVINEVAPKKTK